MGSSLGELAGCVSGDPCLSRLLELIRLGYGETGLSLHRASLHTGLRRSRLTARLRAATGLTFHRLVTGVRILQAIKRMESGDDNLAEVSEACGFGSLSTFYRQFRRELGCAPGPFQACRRRGAEFGPI